MCAVRYHTVAGFVRFAPFDEHGSLLACNSAAEPCSAPQAIPIPAPDTLPTALRQRQDPEPPLDYILVAFEDSVSAASCAEILAGVDGVVEAIARRLRQLVQVFAAGMWPSGISG